MTATIDATAQATIETTARASEPTREIRDLTLGEAEQMLRAIGEPAFRARQIMAWLWQHGAESFDAMTDLPAGLRGWLAANWKLAAADADVVKVARSNDGTRKLLIRAGAEVIESVIIPAGERTTLCISSQAGCAMGCEFCATARMGLRRNLAASEILGQLIAARRYLEGETLTNYVFMGMGEPLANYQRLAQALTIMTAPWGMGISPRRITVSTVGLIPMMERLLAEFQVNLAVSLHATTDELRDRLAPINRRYPLGELIAACRALPMARRRRIMFEYVMLDGVNDSDSEARRLARMLGPLRAKVNLIFFNPFPEAPFAPSPRARVEAFQALLHRGNLTATIRESRGQDIAAACGQLFAEHRQSGGAETAVQAAARD
ncbi:MAG TPA: 23S rRNA (adenine(2503)-C(2))-methyltransferase RlmN [Candidatus Binataceae bacterium]|nr:23S rRNA (adenine(2503)-C(2))-methyltransferase RlmN [Candidatus Binataceae bacterium]